MPKSKDVRDALRITGWSHREIDDFIEKNPRIWFQALHMPSLIDAVDHVEMFLATDPVVSGV